MLIKDLFNNNKRQVKDIFYMMALQGLGYIVPLLVLPYLMKVLGAEKFGYIGFSLAVAQYLMLLVDFGFNFSSTKRIALAKDNPAEVSRIFSSTLYAKLGLLALSFVFLLLLSLIPEFSVYRTTMMVMFLMVVGQTMLFVFLFQGMGEIKWVSIFTCIAKLLVLPFTFLLVKTADDYLWAAFIQGFVPVFAALVSWIMLARKHWVKLVKVSWKYVKEELKESFPIFLSTAATSVYTACFVIVLGYFVSPDQVGQYSAVERIMRSLCYFVLVPVLQVFFPYVSKLRAESNSSALQMLSKLIWITTLLMFLIVIAMWLLPMFLLDFLGPDYQGTEKLFMLMSSLPIFIGIGGVAGQIGLLAIGNEQDKLHFKNVYMIAACIAIPSVLVLAYFYGIYGAAVSLLLTEAWVCIAMYYFARKLYNR